MRTIICILLMLSAALPHELKYILPEEPVLRIQIIYTLNKVDISFNSNWTLLDSERNTSIPFGTDDSISVRAEADRYIIQAKGNEYKNTADFLKLVSSDSSALLTIKDVPYGIGWWWEGREDRIYEGQFEIRRKDDQNLEVIVILPLEKYLCGVIPYEIGGDAPLEALKAQAVAARSDAVDAFIFGKYRENTYDICADVECQVFGGNNKRTETSDRAVKETRGLCLFDGRKIISAYYASNCGGISERIENVWPSRSGPQPYWGAYLDADIDFEYHLKDEDDVKAWINSSPEVYCNPQFSEGLPQWSKNNFRWKAEVPAADLSKNLNKIKKIGALQKIAPLQRGPSGRLIKAAFIGKLDTLILNSELDIRKIKSPPLRSSCFYFETSGETDSLIYTFKGAGWGHGVGMCQTGAVARAKAGVNFKDILQHYFRGTEVKTAFPISIDLDKEYAK